MKKTVVIYDKWLQSLGGGEVVACNMARILKDEGYDVIFISGKKVSLKTIKKKLAIDLTGVKFVEVWNDELSLKENIQNKDLFINITFMDYSCNFAKQSIYYTHFPTKLNNNLKDYFVKHYIFPYLSDKVKTYEFLYQPKGTTMINGRYAHALIEPIDIAFSYLKTTKEYDIKFSIFFESFSRSLINKLQWQIEKAKIVNKKILIDHHHNVIHYIVRVKPEVTTVYLHLELVGKSDLPNKERVYLIHPKILPTIPIVNNLYKRIYEKLNNKIRSGIFVDAAKRLNTYELLVTHSRFVKKWISNYWKKNSLILYPPVDLFFNKYNLSKFKKRNWICSVGRFFTLGHGKKQEILIDVFKKLYDSGYNDWELHLVGGLGNEPSSLAFVDYLRSKALKYPIFFHFNIDRNEVEKIFLQSKIYWHATGYGENELKNPVRFEHFGIAPIEAMSAKCYPILYKGGGLKEIIMNLKLDESLYLFQTKEELLKKTVYHINNPKRTNWNNIFKKLEKDYSYSTFKSSFKNIVNNIMES